MSDKSTLKNRGRQWRRRVKGLQGDIAVLERLGQLESLEEDERGALSRVRDKLWYVLTLEMQDHGLSTEELALTEHVLQVLNARLAGEKAPGRLQDEVLAGIRENVAQARDRVDRYRETLERAAGSAVFKYVLLISEAATDLYVNQARQQAEQSFRLSRRVAIVGFVLLSIGVTMGIVGTFLDRALDAGLLSASGGVLAEFIAGVFFYLYNKNLEQINGFYDHLMGQQHEALTVLATAGSALQGPSGSNE